MWQSPPTKMRKFDTIAPSPLLSSIRPAEGVSSSIASADPSSPYAAHEPSQLRIVTNVSNDPAPQNFCRPAQKPFHVPTFGETTPLNCILPMACPAPSGGQLAEAQSLYRRNARDQGSRAAESPRPPSKEARLQCARADHGGAPKCAHFDGHSAKHAGER
jgi:hypothetical protein